MYSTKSSANSAVMCTAIADSSAERRDRDREAREHMVRSQWVTPGRVGPSPVPLHTLLKICLTTARKAQPRLAGAIIEPFIFARFSLSLYKRSMQLIGLPSRCVVPCDVGLVLRDGPSPSRRTTSSSSSAPSLHLTEHIDEARGRVSGECSAIDRMLMHLRTRPCA